MRRTPTKPGLTNWRPAQKKNYTHRWHALYDSNSHAQTCRGSRTKFYILCFTVETARYWKRWDAPKSEPVVSSSRWGRRGLIQTDNDDDGDGNCGGDGGSIVLLMVMTMVVMMTMTTTMIVHLHLCIAHVRSSSLRKMLVFTMYISWGALYSSL